MQKARKLIERDQVAFLIGDVNSAIAQAIAQVSNEKKCCTSSRAATPTRSPARTASGTSIRVCNTTSMEANSISDLLFTKYGKKWHFITPDYAFGHTLQEACADDLKKLGGTVTGNELTPLGTTDFSAYLIKAQRRQP